MNVLNRNQSLRVLRIPAIFVTLTIFLPFQTMQAQEEHNYKLISPKLVAQGETFTGTVIEETPEGDVPLHKGDQLVFRGEIIDVEEEGKIKIPTFVEDVGTQFVTAEILRASGTSFHEEPKKMEPKRIEIIPVKADLITQIKQTSELISDRFRVKGQGLLDLNTAELVGDNKTITLEEPIASSSLELVYSIPDGVDIQPGEYRFEAKDKDGIKYRAPHQMVKPTLQLSGPPIKHRGQEGEFEITSNVDAVGEILGGEPIIEIPNRIFELKKDETKEVEFIAQQVGDYEVIVNIYDRKDAPVQSDTPPVKEANVGPIKVEYIGNKTELTAPVNVIDTYGDPIKEVTVEIAISYPDGVEYTSIITNEEGSATINYSLEGKLAMADLSILAYNVPGNFWQMESEDEPEGDDPKDTPKPKIYGEEIDVESCDPEFIVTPPKGCELKKIPKPGYKGKLYYFLFPGTKWDKGSAVDKIIEAQDFYEKYCIYLNFDELNLTRNKSALYENRLKTWVQDVKNNTLPQKHMKNVIDKIKAQNPNAAKDAIDNLVKEEVKRILCNSTINGKSSVPPKRSLVLEFYDIVEDLQGDLIKAHKKDLENQIKEIKNQVKELKKERRKANKTKKDSLNQKIKDLNSKKKSIEKEKKKANHMSIVVFMDQYTVSNPRMVRVSATQKNFNQIGITLPDKDSFNILSHELRHLLGKATPNMGGNRTWWHELCPNAVGSVKQGRSWCDSFRFSNELTIESYDEIIKNGAGVKLLKRIK